LEPVPQDLVQAPYLDQPETLQSMGQAYVLQVVVELKPGQPTPPLAVAVTTERVLVLEPVPQDLVQASYLDQPETLQSMGQACMLHTRDSLVGHASPPCLAAMSTA
jgi:hypothetical protein